MAALHTKVKNGELAISPPAYLATRQNMPWMLRIEEHPSWPVLSQVAESMVAHIPMPHFTVGHLLSLEIGKVFTSQTLTSDLIPMKIGSVKLVWGEFEMVNRNLAIRITKLA